MSDSPIITYILLILFTSLCLVIPHAELLWEWMMEWAFSGSILESGDLNSTVSDSVEVKELVDLEFAGTAETRFSNADHWCVDTGASSHITPNVHWFTNYTPHVVAIQVADGKTVHSAGIGTIHFQPHDFNNKPLQTVLISKVLHVPSLTSSLLSPLHLTQHHGFKVIMQAKHIQFVQDNQLRLCASTTGNRNLAYCEWNCHYQYI
jgi:hypothetical protein